MSDANIKLIKKFVNDYSLETTPNVYKKYGSFTDLVDKNHLIYITYLPDENMGNLVETAKKLKLEGYDVIPHLPSRTIKAGGVLYPLPTEVIPIVLSPVNCSRVKSCGKRALGLNVLSVG